MKEQQAWEEMESLINCLEGEIPRLFYESFQGKFNNLKAAALSTPSISQEEGDLPIADHLKYSVDQGKDSGVEQQEIIQLKLRNEIYAKEIEDLRAELASLEGEQKEVYINNPKGILAEITSLRERIAELEGEQKWISVEEKQKPKAAQEIWVYREKWKHVSRKVFYTEFLIGETHWQPVIHPTPPSLSPKDSKTDV